MEFFNPSRSYQETEHGVRFWGYDKDIEISFIVEERALSKIDSTTSTNSEGYLSTFDANRARIQAVASSTYNQRRKGSRPYLITLRVSDF